MELEAEVREFLIECNEYMEVLDRDVLLLEERPEDAELIANVFRAVHTIKGTCGFFGFDLLGSLTHVVESILGQVRERERPLTPQLVSLILESMDVMRVLLGNIESSGVEGDDSTAPLRLRLEEAAQLGTGSLESSAPPETTADALQPQSAEVVSPFDEPAAAVSLGDVPVATAGAGSDSGNDEDTAPSGTRDTNKDAHLAESTIRVDVALLNRLMNLVGELVLARNQLLQDTSSQNAALQQTSQRLNLITSELQEGVMKTRMQPIGVVWNKMPRVVRDLAAKCGKLVRIEMEGAGTELDKTIIEAIKDPLTHIVRNSCDHGIEAPEVRYSKGKLREGLLLLRAYHEGGVVNIEISDDGAGVDPQRVKNKAVEKGLIRPEQVAAMSDREAIHLIFLPGFSTAAQISSVSGRGVGMDVVKTNIEKIGGSVELLNRPNAGTTIRIKIPLTLAIIPGLVVALKRRTESGPQRVEISQERFIIPQANLLELVRVEAAEMKKRVENVHGTPVFHHRGKLLPLVYLGRVLRVAKQPQQEDAINIVVLQAESKQFGLVVDGISDTQEIVVKPLGRQLKGLSCYVGATIMGDGRPALILDVAGLARLARLGVHTRPTTQSVSVSALPAPSAEPQMMLLFRAGGYERMAVPLALVDRLEEVRLSAVEFSGGVPVLHYRGEILPLLSIVAGQLPSQSNGDSDPVLQVIVFTDGKRRTGLVVDQIVDIVNEVVTSRRQTAAPGVMGSALIGGRITDLLDLPSLVSAAGEDWLSSVAPSEGSKKRTVMLIDSAPFSREVLQEHVRTAGYEVISARCVRDALMRAREGNGVAAIVLNAHGDEPHRQELAEAICRDEVLARIPVAEMVDEPGPNGSHIGMQLPRADVAVLLQQLPGLIASGVAREAA